MLVIAPVLIDYSPRNDQPKPTNGICEKECLMNLRRSADKNAFISTPW